jgi:hypothetical protein
MVAPGKTSIDDPAAPSLPTGPTEAQKLIQAFEDAFQQEGLQRFAPTT